MASQNYREQELIKMAQVLAEKLGYLHDKGTEFVGLDKKNLERDFLKCHKAFLALDDKEVSELRDKYEESRVRTLSQGNVFTTCLLTSMVALNYTARKPKKLRRKPSTVLLDKIPRGVKLMAFAISSFYYVVGNSAKARYKGKAKFKKNVIDL